MIFLGGFWREFEWGFLDGGLRGLDCSCWIGILRRVFLGVWDGPFLDGLFCGLSQIGSGYSLLSPLVCLPTLLMLHYFAVDK